MKKIIVFLISMFFVSNVWALPDQIKPVEYNGSQSIKSTAGMVCSATMNYIGAVAGNKIQLLDGTDSTGTVRLTLVAATTAGNQIAPLTSCAYFSTGIYYLDPGHSGTLTTDIQSF